jgi:hypothetical protein
LYIAFVVVVVRNCKSGTNVSNLLEIGKHISLNIVYKYPNEIRTALYTSLSLVKNPNIPWVLDDG